MGKKSTPSAPAPPDPYAVAAAQGAQNTKTAKEQAKLNRINEYTPFGSVEYGNTGKSAAPYKRTTKLNKKEQKRLDAQRGLDLNLTNLGSTVLDRISPNLSKSFSYKGLPKAPDAGTGYLKSVEDALMARLNPQFARDEETLRTQLANQGIGLETDAYGSAYDDFNRAKNDARLGAVLASGSEASRLFGLESAERERAVQEAAFARSQPINEIASLLGTAGGINVPQFGAVPQVGVGGVDIAGPMYANYQGQLNNYNQQQQNKQANMGGLFGLGGSVLAAGLGPGGFFLS